MESFMSRNLLFYFQISVIFMIFTGASDNICRLWSNARYFNGYCYYVSNTTLTYKQAKISCEQMDMAGGMKLAEPKTDSRYLFLKDMVMSLKLPTRRGFGLLLGGVRVAQTKSFIWSSGGTVTDWWAPSRPDDHLLSENCLEMRSNYNLMFNDVNCWLKNYYACEKYIGNPCDSVLTGGDYYDGICYKVYNQLLVWNDSIKACEQESGHLAEPRSFPVVNFLLLMIKTTPGQTEQDSYFLGASDVESEGTFRWLTNDDPMTVNFWASGEPSNPQDFTLENYLAISALTMKFNDVSGDFKAKFFCQKKLTDVWKHTYLVVLPKKLLLSRAQLMIASSERQGGGIYRVLSQTGDDYDTHQTSGNAVIEVSLAVEPRKVIDLNPYLGLRSSGLFKQYVIRSSQELTVILSTQHTTLNPFDITASLILRTALLGQNYHLLSVPHGRGQLAVTALTQHGADVILKVPPNYRQDAVLSVRGVSLRHTGYASLTLGMHQTVVFEVRHLKSGFIYATSAIAVTYLEEMAAQEESTWSGHSLDMLIPAELMTTEYITFPSWPLTEQPEHYQLLALHDYTFITICGPETQTVVLSLAGDVQEISLPGSAFFYLKSDVLFQARKTSTSEANGACVTTLLPSSLWQTHYVYVTPTIDIFPATEANITMSSVLFLISENPQFDISYPVVGSCLQVEGTNLSGCYFPIAWGMLEPVYITNNDTVFAAYTAWIRDNSTLLTCYPLSVDTSGTYRQNFDGLGNINFNDTVCNLVNELTTVDSTVSSSSSSSSSVMYNTATFQTEVILNDTEESTTYFLPTTQTNNVSTSQDIITTTYGIKPVLTPTTGGFYNSLKYLALEMNHKDTSTYRRTKISIADMRVSSVTIGVTGVIFLCTLCAIIVLPDLLSFIKFLIGRGLFQNQSPIG